MGAKNEDKTRQDANPIFLFLTVVVSIFAAEILIMFLLHIIAPFSQYMEMVVDASALVVLVFPTIYFFSFRPLTSYIAVQNKLNEELQQSHEKLKESLEGTMNAMAQLKESKGKFVAISVAAQDAIITMDDEGNISFWNEAAERIFGYSRKEAVGNRVGELIIPHRYRLAHIEGVKKFKETGKGPVIGKIIELEATRKNGEEFPVELSLSALMLKERWCAVGIIRDISKRVRREEELRLSYKMASLGQLTAGIFHEILNPINIISTHVQLLLADTGKGSDVEKDLKSIQEEIKRVQDITDGFLRFSRKESVATKEIDVNQLLNRVLAILVAEIKYKNIHLFKKFDNELPLFKANAELLRQVFLNLIKNAIDAMANGGSLTISTLKCLKDEKPCLCIQFTDTGCGIPKEHLDKIFDPFFTTKEEGKGVGMGLTIAYTTIQNHGGSISVSSEVGKGSTFTIELPLQPTDQNKAGKL